MAQHLMLVAAPEISVWADGFSMRYRRLACRLTAGNECEELADSGEKLGTAHGVRSRLTPVSMSSFSFGRQA